MGRQLHDCTDCYGTHSRDNVTKPHQLDYKLTLAGPLASVRRPNRLKLGGMHRMTHARLCLFSV
jgi:hypothetical protein